MMAVILCWHWFYAGTFSGTGSMLALVLCWHWFYAGIGSMLARVLCWHWFYAGAGSMLALVLCWHWFDAGTSSMLLLVPTAVVVAGTQNSYTQMVMVGCTQTKIHIDPKTKWTTLCYYRIRYPIIPNLHIQLIPTDSNNVWPRILQRHANSFSSSVAFNAISYSTGSL